MSVIYSEQGRMWSDVVPHTAYWANGWVVSWLPRRLLTGRQAWIALRLAELYCGPVTPGSKRWRRARQFERELGIEPGRSGQIASSAGVAGW